MTWITPVFVLGYVFGALVVYLRTPIYRINQCLVVHDGPFYIVLYHGVSMGTYTNLEQARSLAEQIETLES